MKLRNILVGYNGSEACERAVRIAQEGLSPDRVMNAPAFDNDSANQAREHGKCKDLCFCPFVEKGFRLRHVSN